MLYSRLLLSEGLVLMENLRSPFLEILLEFAKKAVVHKSLESLLFTQKKRDILYAELAFTVGFFIVRKFFLAGSLGQSLLKKIFQSILWGLMYWSIVVFFIPYYFIGQPYWLLTQEVAHLFWKLFKLIQN